MQKYNYKNLSTIAFVYGISTIGILIMWFFAYFGDKNPISKITASIDTACILNCVTNTCKSMISKFRGSNYNPTNAKTRTIKNCFITFWNITHFILYTILAYLVPSFYIEFFFIGVLWEILEYFTFKCHDANDLFSNLAGIMLGRALSP